MIVKPLEQVEIDLAKKDDCSREVVICVAKSKGITRKHQYSGKLGLGSQWRYYKTSDAWQHQKWLAQHYLGLDQSKSIMAFSTDLQQLSWAMSDKTPKIMKWKDGKPQYPKRVLNFKDYCPELNYVIFDGKEYNEFNKLLKDKKQEDKVFADYKKQWDEASIKYCFEKGDLARAGTLDSTRARYLNKQLKDNKVAIRRKLFDKLIAKYPEIKYNKYNNNKEDNTMAKQGLYALATIIDKDKNESFEMKQVSNENKKVEAGLFSKTVKAKHADCTVEVQLVKFKRTVY
jgi:hypothetical protein